MIGDLKWLKTKLAQQSVVTDSNGPQPPGQAKSHELVKDVPMPDIYGFDGVITSQILRFPMNHLPTITNRQRSVSDMIDESSATAQHYELVSVRRVKSPLGAAGTDWHRYVIAFDGANNIHGHRQGNFSAVKRAVEEIVVQLNERCSSHWKKCRSLRQAPKKKPHK